MRLMLLLLYFPLLLHAQVINDDIHQAMILNIGTPLSSSTAKATIQPECVNYALTKKCIKYHNDQWFIFNSGRYDHLYINVAGQECRDLLGVQLVVLEGEPCDTENYGLIECVSFSSNDNFYVKADSLKPETNYLLNIDGYLHDFCSFEIVVDTVPHGMPNEVNLTLESKTKQDSSIVQIRWFLSDSIKNEIRHFEVWRRKENEFKHNLHYSILVRRNTYGSIDTEYAFEDTITENSVFHYRLLAVDYSGKKLLYGEHQFRGVEPLIMDALKIKLYYAKGTPISLKIYDRATGEMFRKVRFSYDPDKHSLLEYPIGYLTEKGVKTVVVEVSNDSSGEVFTREYKLR